jgi:Family of unknown function (DUF6527)
MRQAVMLRHAFVESAPDKLEEGIIYVSIRYRSALHKCCCGCGNEVVTPIGPTDWKVIFDGVSVSLDPSIGNWSLPCRSHYWIKNNRAYWAQAWSEDQIDSGRARDRAAKERHLEAPAPEIAVRLSTDPSELHETGALTLARSWLARLRGRPKSETRDRRGRRS